VAAVWPRVSKVAVCCFSWGICYDLLSYFI
jgi:hypothetical protein